MCKKIINRAKTVVYRTCHGLMVGDHVRNCLMWELEKIKMEKCELCAIAGCGENCGHSLRENPQIDIHQNIQAPSTFEDALDYVLGRLRQVMIREQRDYGPRNILDSGEVGVVVRANDKMARLRNLYGITDGSYKQKTESNESIDDSFIDFSNYGVIGLMVRWGIFNLPLAGIPSSGKKSNEMA